nr:GNAT family N-acetyltransferase [Sporolactobacillus sp. STSJ-5]
MILREIVYEDAQSIFDCFSNDNVTRYYGQDNLTSIEQAQQFVAFFSRNYSEKRGIRWSIERKEQPGLIGTIGFNAWSSKHRRAEIGYELHPHYWHKGYAKEAVTEVISYGFSDLHLTRIGAVVFTENTASNRLLMKLGFKKEGLLRNYIYQNGVAHDTITYAFLPDNQ